MKVFSDMKTDLCGGVHAGADGGGTGTDELQRRCTGRAIPFRWKILLFANGPGDQGENRSGKHFPKLENLFAKTRVIFFLTPGKIRRENFWNLAITRAGEAD